MAKRKTISVIEMVDYANLQLSRTDDFATKEFKQGIIVMVEAVLHRSDNYNGFRFLDNSDNEFDTMGYVSRYYYGPRFKV